MGDDLFQPHHVADRRRLREAQVTQLAYVRELELNPDLRIATQIPFFISCRCQAMCSNARISREIFKKREDNLHTASYTDLHLHKYILICN